MPPTEAARAYWETLADLAGRDSAAALRLARQADSLVRHAPREPLSWRALGLARRLRGRWIESAEAFQEAAKLSTGTERWSLAIGAVDGLARARRFDEARRLGDNLFRSLTRRGERHQAGRAALNLGNANTWAEDDDAAARWYVRALDLLSLDAPSERAAATLGLAASLLMRRPTESARWAEIARSEFDRLGLGHYARLAEITLAQCCVLQGRFDEGRRGLIAVRDALGETADGDALRLEQFLGDAYLGMGMPREALDAYEKAFANPSVRSLPFNDLLCWIGAARCRHALGDASGATAAWRKCQAIASKRGNALWIGAVRALAADSAASPSESLRLATRALEMGGPMHGTVYEAIAVLCAASADPTPERLATAKRVVGRIASPELDWKLEWVLARTKPKSRATHYRRMFRAMLEDRALRNTLEGRAAVFADKGPALEDYLGWLLARPTPSRVREAVGVVQQARSAALLDELLAAGRAPLNDDQVAILTELRREMAEQSGVGSRLAAGGHRTRMAASARRRLRESLGPALAKREAVLRESRSGTVFVVCGQAIHALREDRIVEASLDRATLARHLRWSAFDLAARPKSGDTGQEALERFASWAKPVLGQDASVFPDGELWGFPWGLASSLGMPERVVGLHPTFGIGEATVQESSRVLILGGDPTGLPHIADEVRSVASRFKNARVVRSVKDLYDLRGASFDIVHVAAHAGHNADNPMFSTIQLADGPLFAAEFASLGLRSQFVFLDACETGRVSLEAPTEPDGWVRAALATGCGACLAATWVVDDAAALSFAEAFYPSLLGGCPVTPALSEARSAVRRRWPHPFYWGPFVLFGGYAL
ncbi:MAG: hypothetical protein AMXMBFR81_02950 [Chthonomonas sp.]